MTNRIHQLPDDLIARIAAGEVVERPASALKELIENSLDAGARRLVVTIEGAGRTRLCISDDGCGMTLEDARLSLRRHATSKISRLEDLEGIQSFGFRGEALPSIAAVSRMTLTTRAVEEDSGWELVLDGGKVVSEKPRAREPGTTVDVRDLFFNTPARFKFLKSDATERGQCLRVLEEAVFAAPEVEFELRIEAARPLVFRAGQSTDESSAVEILRRRLGEAWGPRWSKGVVPVFSRNAHFAAAGVVTDQGFHQGSGRNQILYINRRPVQNRRLARAVYDAYQGQLPSLRHPGWVIFLTVDPATIDVNVHPSKREVKLTHESELFGFLQTAVRAALTRTPEAPVAVFTAPLTGEGGRASFSAPPAAESPFAPAAAREASHDLYKPLADLWSPMGSGSPLPSAHAPAAAESRPELAELRDPSLTVLGQARRTFIVAQTSNGILLADQHAAAEKVAYERLLANLKAARPEIQMMLVPFVWEVALALASTIHASLAAFGRFGFIVEPFGGSSFVVKGIPAVLGDKFDLHVLLDAMCDAVAEPADRRGATLEHRLAAAAACKASVKAGDPLDAASARTILAELAACESPYTCPHGRPTLLRLPYADLELRFRRR